ncbi:hypothetical protein CJI53_02965 [Bifidobacteriaceae bacterium VN002]|nr:hypothetical protein CG395_03755 [Bifidobacteriaceae bacterium GH022]RIY22106.1 hypothetical protein CJI53_02965 [Bifidobacteriaceae bacterium VN002]
MNYKAENLPLYVVRLYQKTPKFGTNALQEIGISAMDATQKFKHIRGLGDSWSNSIRAAADTKKPNDTRLQTNFNQKQNQSQIGTTATTINT